MERKHFFDRFGTTILLAMAVSIPFLCQGVGGLLQSASNDPRQWLPEGLTEARDYEYFQRHFGRDEIAVVSWPGCTLDDARVESLADALLQCEPRYFDRVLTGPQVLDELTSGPAGLDRSEAIDRLRGNLVGYDGRTTGLVLVVSPEGERNRKLAIRQVEETAARVAGIAETELRFGGPTVDAATLDRESQRMLYLLAGLCAAVVFVGAWWQMRSLYVAAMIIVCALYNTAATLAVACWTGGRMNLTMTNIVPLVFVLSVSMSIHLVNYYRDALRERVAGARERAVSMGWLPCLFAAGTTAIGFVSLAFSSVGPIRDFGVYSAVGMVISFAVLLLFLPAALWPRFMETSPATGTLSTHAALRRRRGASWAARLAAIWDRLARGGAAAIIRRYGAVSLTCVGLMLVAAPGLSRLEATVKLQHRFPDDSRIVQDSVWLEEHIAPLVPMEILVRFENAAEWRLLDKMRAVEAVQAELSRMKHVESTMSAVTLSPPLPERRNLREAVRARIFERRMSEQRNRLVGAHYLADVGSAEVWRITARLDAMSEVDYGHYIDEIRSRLDPLIAREWGPGVSAVYTGAVPLIYKAQRLLLYDLAESFFGAFAVIAIVMALALGSVRAGLLAMIPNVFPVVLVFGAMGWNDFLVEIGTVSTASIALGIAVDNTFHYFTWFRRGLREGLDRRQAAEFGYGHCARAMIQTTCLCIVGLLVFTLSNFLPTVRFAWLMLALLGAALAGDIILLPALLVGPLGRCFRTRSIMSESEAGAEFEGAEGDRIAPQDAYAVGQG